MSYQLQKYRKYYLQMQLLNPVIPSKEYFLHYELVKGKQKPNMDINGV